MEDLFSSDGAMSRRSSHRVGMEEKRAHVDAEQDRVYRPLLFDSTGYASSTLFHDDYEMRTRLPTTLQPTAATRGSLSYDGNDTAQDDVDESRHPHSTIRPHIRLETLSSRAATTVLWVTYMSFMVAIALPYLQRQGLLETTVPLSGAYCVDRVPTWDPPCTRRTSGPFAASWQAVVENVSWYAGSMELRLRVAHPVKNATRDVDAVSTVSASLLQELDGVGRNDSAPVMDVSVALQYNLRLFGIDTTGQEFVKDLIVLRRNQSRWLSCDLNACEVVELLDLRDRVMPQRRRHYESYLLHLEYYHLYPNLLGKDVEYDFAYTKPAIHISELIVRATMLAATVLALPCWLISVVNSHGSWNRVLRVQKWVFALGVVLILWQNPVNAVTEWYTMVSTRTVFVSRACESIAEAFLYVFWLTLMDEFGGVRRLGAKLWFGMVLLAVELGMNVLQVPDMFALLRTWTREEVDQAFVILGFLRIFLLLCWLSWIVRISWRTGLHLRRVRYMTTRFQQLSYRFLFLETVLILIYVLLVSVMLIFQPLRAWYLLGEDAFIQVAADGFAARLSGRPSLGKFLFLSVYVYLMMFVHLPPRGDEDDNHGIFGSTAFHVDERPRVDKYGFLLPTANLFCVETAVWLLELAWQAYYDPPGRPSPFGYGDLELEKYGFELITHLRSNLTDTHAIVAMSLDRKRLVVAFRGTTSKQNWKSNLRFHQEVLWIKSRGFRRGTTFLERLKGITAKIPVLNMALPRAHSGFWNAYASVRAEMKEVMRLVLDENPGISVYVTGHSMGGALAVLAAYDLAVNFSIKVSMYNFGGPRVGNPSFVQHYNRCVPTSFRVVMDGDIVPGVPRFWGLYQHVGTEIAIDTEGNLIVDPSFVERHLHVSSKRRVATHATHVYRASMAKCFDVLLAPSVPDDIDSAP